MIGIFDSGSGGLTVLRAIRETLPSADITYFGDISRAPYGSRSREELSRFTMESLRFLEKSGATSFVSACNSVSASLALSLLDTLETEPRYIIEMVGPTVGAFRGATERLLLVATPATIESGIYQNAFTMIGVPCTFVAIPDLAGAIEFGESDQRIESLIREALEPFEDTYDILILACTHYPLVSEIFARVAPHVDMLDPAFLVAERAERRLWPREAGEGKLVFYVTKESEPFRRRVSALFGSNQRIEVVTV
jgi:glutamate racemase